MQKMDGTRVACTYCGCSALHTRASTNGPAYVARSATVTGDTTRVARRAPTTHAASCTTAQDPAGAPGVVAARFGSKQRPRAARAEAARVGRWWPWLDSYSVTLFVQQYDRSTCCELLLAINTWYRYLIRGTRGLRIIRKKCNACFYMEQRIRFYTRTKFKNEVTNRSARRINS